MDQVEVHLLVAVGEGGHLDVRGEDEAVFRKHLAQPLPIVGERSHSLPLSNRLLVLLTASLLPSQCLALAQWVLLTGGGTTCLLSNSFAGLFPLTLASARGRCRVSSGFFAA